MKYLVMECKRSYAIVADESGYFYRAANLNYQVGETVENPILMKESVNYDVIKQRSKKGYWWLGAAITAIACFILVFAGYYQDTMKPFSSIYISINPSIQIELNKKGEVIELIPTNEDGKLLLEAYTQTSKDKQTVIDEIVDKAIEMGYLLEGGQIKVCIKTNSEELFVKYGKEIRKGMHDHLEGSIVIEINIDKYSDDNSDDRETPITETTPPINGRNGNNVGGWDNDNGEDWDNEHQNEHGGHNNRHND